VAAKVSEDGVRETPAGATPVPLSATVCARNWSLTVSVAERAPVAEGMKVTVMAQVECAASEVPQELTAVKSPAETLTAISVRATSPELVSVTCCAVLVVPICCCAKVSASGASVSVAGPSPTPVS
jgi:hypothetical protein